MHVQPRQFDKLKKRLRRAILADDLALHRELIRETAAELDIDVLDCAAALLKLSQPHLLQASQKTAEPAPAPPTQPPATEPKMSRLYRKVRYRLDVGKNHQVSENDIMAVLIEESGVDRKCISRIEMRDSYTLVDLPEGMPADIFQLLTEAEVGGQQLNIKRVKPNRKRSRDFSGRQAAG